MNLPSRWELRVQDGRRVDVEGGVVVPDGAVFTAGMIVGGVGEESSDDAPHDGIRIPLAGHHLHFELLE